jgi:hypothetical protein
MSVGAAIPVFCACVAATSAPASSSGASSTGVSERLGVSEGLHGILTALGGRRPGDLDRDRRDRRRSTTTPASAS